MPFNFVNRYLSVLLSTTFVMTFVIGTTPSETFPLPMTPSNQQTIDLARRVATQCLNGRKVIPQILYFRIVPGNSFTILWSPEFVGLTLGKTIYVAEGSERDFTVYAHEMIHASGVVGHPKEYFEDCHL